MNEKLIFWRQKGQDDFNNHPDIKNAIFEFPYEWSWDSNLREDTEQAEKEDQFNIAYQEGWEYASRIREESLTDSVEFRQELLSLMRKYNACMLIEGIDINGINLCHFDLVVPNDDES